MQADERSETGEMTPREKLISEGRLATTATPTSTTTPNTPTDAIFLVVEPPDLALRACRASL
eukprot:2211361-Rhodomonas_salina.1